MSDSSTLHSRLRVLVAKAFKAERLYAAMRNNTRVEVDKPNAVSELANNVRAREWQRCHALLREQLNEILSNSSSRGVSDAVSALHDAFRSEFLSAQKDTKAGAQEIVEASKREEFAQVVKLSLELVKNKARAEVSRIIADELEIALGGNVKTSTLPKIELNSLAATTPSTEEAAMPVAANVLPFRPRKVSSAGGRR